MIKNPITLSKPFLKFFVNQLDFNRAESITEFDRTPKVHENGLLLYKSENFANTVRYGRGCDYAYTGFLLLFSS